MTIKTYGDFILASRVRIDLPRKQFLGGPWTHLATVTRSLREYVAILHAPTQKIYLEEISATGKFHAIEEDQLWVDLLNFLVAEGVLGFSKDKEIIQGLDFGK